MARGAIWALVTIVMIAVITASITALLPLRGQNELGKMVCHAICMVVNVNNVLVSALALAFYFDKGANKWMQK